MLMMHFAGHVKTLWKYFEVKEFVFKSFNYFNTISHHFMSKVDEKKTILRKNSSMMNAAENF